MNKILILPDFQIPDHDQKLFPLIFEFISDFAPDHVFLIGDVLNMTGVATYEPAPHYTISVKDEIDAARPIIEKLELQIRRANSQSKITWIKGNHEYRLERFLARSANAIAEIKINGQYALSIESLFDTRRLNIETVPYQRESRIGNVIIEHGDVARKFSGYTAKAMLESRGESGFSGHTHRLGYHSRTVAGKTMFWIETGSLCNADPEPNYVRRADWQKGFALAYENDGVVFPQLVPIFNSSFVVDGKLYSYERKTAEATKRSRKEQLNKTLSKLANFTRPVL